MPQYQFPNLLDGRTPRCHATSTETYPDLENLPHLPGPTNHFLPYIGHRTPQETIPLSVPLSSFSFSTSFWFSVFGVFWVFCFFVFLFFVFLVLWFVTFVSLDFVFFVLLIILPLRLIESLLNSLLLLNLFNYVLLYLIFCALYIFCNLYLLLCLDVIFFRNIYNSR